MDGTSLKNSRLKSNYKYPVRTNDDIFEIPYRVVGLVHLIQAGDLNQPTHVVRVELIVNNPLGKLVPFTCGSSVDTDTPLAVLTINDYT